MVTKKITDNLAKTYIEILTEHGEDGLYRRLVGMGITRYASNITNPEIELLDLAEAFFIYYRSNGNEDYFNIGKVFRRAAHKIYRHLKKNNKTENNVRFLNIIQ